SAVFFPDACAEEDRCDVFEVLADTLKPVYQADDLDDGGVDDADVKAVDQHRGRGSGDAAVVEGGPAWGGTFPSRAAGHLLVPHAPARPGGNRARTIWRAGGAARRVDGR